MLSLVFIFLNFILIFSEDIPFIKGDILKSNNNSSLFNEALDDFTLNKFDSALKKFNKLLKKPNLEDEQIGILLFNLALTLENLSKYNKALQTYESITLDSKIKFLHKDSYYRMSAICHETRDATCVIKNLARWKRSEIKLSLAQDFEFMVRTGVSYYNLNSMFESIKYLKSAINIYKNKYPFLIKNAQSIGLEKEKINALALLSFENLGKAYVNSGNKINLSFPLTQDQKIIRKRLENALELKAFYYIKAQDVFFDMIEAGDRFIASKGLFEIGNMYKNVYFELLNSQIPDDIKEHDLSKEYKKELKSTLLPLYKKALIALNKNIEYAKTFKYSNEWINKSIIVVKELKNNA